MSRSREEMCEEMERVAARVKKALDQFDGLTVEEARIGIQTMMVAAYAQAYGLEAALRLDDIITGEAARDKREAEAMA